MATFGLPSSDIIWRMSPNRRDFLITTAAAFSASRILGANDRVQVGFIGYGLIGAQHVHDFRSLPDVDLVAISDVYEPRLREGRAACSPRCQGYTDFRRLLEHPDIQAVVISTPDHWHALLAVMACAAGKDVYVEKPLTLFVREGRWMIAAAKRYERVVQVGTQQRSGRHYVDAVKMLQDGYIGKIHTVRMGSFRNVMPGFGTPSDADPPPELNYDLWLGPAPKRQYNPNRSLYHFRWFWDYSGGQMTNLGAHEIDVIHWAMKTRAPLAVASAGGRFALTDNGETPDTQDSLFEYPGFTALWSHREASRGRGQGEGLEFFGTNGSMKLDRSGFQVFPDLRVPPQNQIPEFEGHPAGGPQRVPTAPIMPWCEPVKRSAYNDLLASHARNFIDCVKSRQQPVSSLEEEHQVAAACHLANISLRLGRKVRWDADRDEIIGDAEASAMLVRPYRNPWDQTLAGLQL
jgi:predicted dehydrogenase